MGKCTNNRLFSFFLIDKSMYLLKEIDIICLFKAFQAISFCAEVVTNACK
jgi:hypothetical protein